MKYLQKEVLIPQRIFLCFSIIFGVIIIFTLPPLTGTDEFTHFPRAYQVSEGIWWEKSLPAQQYGGELPSHVNQFVNDYRDLSRKSDPISYHTTNQLLFERYAHLTVPGEKTAAATFTSVVVYPPWAYIGPVIGITAARLLHLPLLWYVYLARLFCLVIWIGLTFLAIRLLPTGKWFVVVLALLPTSLTQALTIGADGLINGLSWLLIAVFLAGFANTLKPRRRELLLVSLACVLLSTIKDSYWLIALLPLTIPRFHLCSSKQAAWIWRIATALLVFISGLWFALKSSRLASTTVLTPRLGVYINSAAQQHYVMHHALLFSIRALLQPFTKSYDTIYLGMLGILTNRLIYLPILVIGLLMISLTFTLYAVPRQRILHRLQSRLIPITFIVIIGTLLLISLSFYLANTQVGGSVIFGIYGRYFLPLFPLLIAFPACFSSRTRHSSRIVYQAVLLCITLPSLITTVLSLRA